MQLEDRAAERDLIGRLVDGEEAAFEALVRLHGGRMLATARRLLGNDHDAKDAVQDAFISVNQSMSTFSGESLGAWLRKIVINRCLMKIRSRKRKREDSIDDLLPQFGVEGEHLAEPPAWREACDIAMERDETRRMVRGLIDRLPEPYQSALLLRDIEELSTREAATLFEISEAAMKVRLHRARQALRKLLEAHFAQQKEDAP